MPKVFDGRALAFADLCGNRQYIAIGNLNQNPKALLFLMDCAHSRRVKVGHCPGVRGRPRRDGPSGGRAV